MKKRTSAGFGKIKSNVMLGLGLALLAASGAAVSGTHGISGTYAVKYDRTCVRSPYRAAAAPAFFNYSTPDTAGYGFVEGPAGMTQPQLASLTNRSAETGSYLMTINAANGTVSISNGTYHSVPFVPHTTVPPAVADFGTFSGSGTFTAVGTSIDISTQTIALVGDGVTQILASNTKNHLETQDKGDTFYSLVGRGSIILQHNLTANLYRDVHCAGFVTGNRVGK